MCLSKIFKSSILLLIILFGFSSCRKEGCTDQSALNYNGKAKKDNGSCQYAVETEDFQLVTSMSNTNHTVEFYTKSGKFQTGYNTVFFKIKNADGSYVENATASWTPMMYMTGMSHSCPVSTIQKKQGSSSTYSGYIVFQMASNGTDYWKLTMDYSVNGVNYSVADTITVIASQKRVMESFMGSDNKRYVVALVEPSEPKVGINDMKAVVYEMESMMSFIAVENYKIKIDPRMPGMGNHSSPNNVDLTKGNDEMYYGKLSLTMTGYWKINLQLEDGSGNNLKGEVVTESNESSSIYFEIEF